MAAIILPRKHYTQPAGRAVIAPEWYDDGAVYFAAGGRLPVEAVLTGSAPTVGSRVGPAVNFNGSSYFTDLSKALYPPQTAVVAGIANASGNVAIGGSGLTSSNNQRTQFDLNVGKPRSICVNGSGGASVAESSVTLSTGEPFYACMVVFADRSTRVFCRGRINSATSAGGSTGTYNHVRFGALAKLTALAPYNGPLSLFALLPYSVDDDTGLSISENPWQIFRADPVRIYSLPPVITIPALSNPGVIDITTTSARPQVTLAF